MNNADILGEEAAVRQIVEGDFSATNGVFEDDSVTSIRGNTFRDRNNLKEIKLPNCTTLLSGGSQATSCNMLKKVYFPKVNSGTYAYGFQECPKLVFADIGWVNALEAAVFNNCKSLIAVIIRGDSVSKLSQTGVFGGTKYATSGAGGAYVYVPRNLISSYQTATNWSTLYAAHSDMFRALEDYTVDGTTTGEIKESLIFVHHTPIYSLQNTAFNGSSDYIDTNIQIFDGGTPTYTIYADFTINSWTTNQKVFSTAGFSVGRHSSNNNNFCTYFYAPGATGGAVDIDNTITPPKRIKGFWIINGMNLKSEQYNENDSNFRNPIDSTNTGTLSSSEKTLLIGARDNNGTIDGFFNGTIHNLKIYDSIIDYWELYDELF